MTNKMKNIVRMVLSIIFVAFALTGVSHACSFEGNTKNTFKNGYEKAILDAVLVESSESGYVLSFGGEEHYYTFDYEKDFAFSYESKMKDAFENGYNQAIEDAVLVESNEIGYILSFNGELHSYTF